MDHEWQWTETRLFLLSRLLTWGLTEYLQQWLTTQDWAGEDREATTVATIMVWIQRYQKGDLSQENLQELLAL
ncbi:MAG: hypothetical protein Q6J68_06650, partial [Thermostichales cyanobacterium SZTDM-1c_bins_54]